MKLTLTDAAQVPVEGNRSLNYIGIERRFDMRFFGVTSDRCVGYRPEPRFICCERSEHTRLKRLLIKGAQDAGLSAEEAEHEWRDLIRKATVECTKEFARRTGSSPLEPVSFSRETVTDIRESIRTALCWLEANINSMTRYGRWSLVTPRVLPLEGSETIIYVKMQRFHSKERAGVKAYKVGKTNDEERRSRAHATSNTDLEHICSFVERGKVTEKNVHRWLGEPMDGAKEWFLLSDEKVEVLKCPFKLEAAIADMLKNYATS